MDKQSYTSWGLLVLLIGCSMHIFADHSVGVIGGTAADGTPYAAFLFADGSISPIVGLPEGTIINTVGINASGVAVIGGTNNYAAFITPNGIANPLLLSQPHTCLKSTALNDQGIGLIGGEDHLGTPYAAYVSTDSLVDTPLTLPPFSGTLNSVAINDSGTGIIAGCNQSIDACAAFAALTTPGEPSVMILNSPIASEPGSAFLSSAINNQGEGLIGGKDGSGQAFAGYFNPDTQSITPFLSPFEGTIHSVAINNAGEGIIGGQSGTTIYAALVHSDHSITPIDLTATGRINSVAINDAGVGVIIGEADSAYKILIAPDTTLTPIHSDPTNHTTIPLATNLANSLVPRSIGPYLSPFYTQLSASNALNMRFLGKNRVGKGIQAHHKLEHLALNEPYLADNHQTSWLINRKKPPPPVQKPLTQAKSKNNSCWLNPFGDFIYVKAEGAIPKYSNEIAGALLGYDHQIDRYLLGGALGYAFNQIGYSERLGHGAIQEETAVIYGACYTDYIWVDLALWGGLYQLWNTRKIPSISITSHGMTQGWMLTPHLQAASPWAITSGKSIWIEPFFALDWVNSWQGGYTEAGRSGFHLQMKKIYGSLLQSEVGLRFYETIPLSGGDICLEQKLSYVNQAPFVPQSVATSFVSSLSSFPIAVSSNQLQNLAAGQIDCFFVPKNRALPYGGLSFKGMGSSSYQSYTLNLFGGIDF